jgi:hypothetical protein
MERASRFHGCIFLVRVHDLLRRNYVVCHQAIALHHFTSHLPSSHEENVLCKAPAKQIGINKSKITEPALSICEQVVKF